jgi:predicted GIY-YIG superfamily endonuclease
MAERNTSKYELTRGNKVVYVGITEDPAGREAQHRQDKDFDKMRIVGAKSTRSGAEQWETERIHTYMKNHGGNTPEYNKNTSGK